MLFSPALWNIAPLYLSVPDRLRVPMHNSFRETGALALRLHAEAPFLVINV